MTPEETTSLLAALCDQYPREDITPQRLQWYCEMLADLSFEDAKGAMMRAAAKSEFFPSIAKIREEAANAAVDHTPDPEAAWGLVVSAIGRYGMHRRPTFDNPHLMDAVDAIGWRELCLSKEGDSTIRAQFREAYKASRERARTDARVPAIARTPDQQRRLGGGASLGKLLGGGE